MQKLKKIPEDLLIILIWTALTIVFILVPYLEDTFIRTILGIPMVLFIPGYMLIAALFPKKDDLESTTRIALSFGLSIAVVPLLGLLLNFTFGIRLVPILLTLCLYTVFLAIITTYRRDQFSEKERFSIQCTKIFKSIKNDLRKPKTRNDKILTAILICSIIIALSMIYFVITTPKIGESFTEFYILDPQGKANNYATGLEYDIPASIIVGVVNHEYIPLNYTIQVFLDRQFLGDTRLRLEHNKTWENNISFAPDKEGKDMKLEFQLFKEDNFTAPYRELHLWVNVTK